VVFEPRNCEAGKRVKTAEHYINIFCTFAIDAQLNADIAAMSPTILGKLIEHRGEMPSGSGYFHDVLTGKIDKLRTVHPDFEDARLVLSKLYKKHAKAICSAIAWRYLINRTIEWKDDKGLQRRRYMATGKDIAEHIKVDYANLKRNRARALDLINAEFGIFVA
jgi:hypothetical protein